MLGHPDGDRPDRPRLTNGKYLWLLAEPALRIDEVWTVQGQAPVVYAAVSTTLFGHTAKTDLT